MQNQFSEIVTFLLQSLALRWFVFDYKKMEFFRKLILRGFLAELAICTFCQGFEAGLITYLSNIKNLPFNQSIFFWPLTAGFVSLVLESFFLESIKNLENAKNFLFTARKNYDD